MISWEFGVVTEYSRWARAARQGVRLQLLQLGDAIINLSVPLKPLAVKLHCETEIAPSRSHVIRPALQFNTTLLLQQLLVGFVRMGRLMGVFVFR
ncbi:hypothetical protein JOQ06_028297, partial [Pogonophryne albipinna]